MYKIYKRGGEGVQKSYTRTDAIAYYLKLFWARIGKDKFCEESCGQDRLVGLALWPHDQFYLLVAYGPMHKIDKRSKNLSLGNYPCLFTG